MTIFSRKSIRSFTCNAGEKQDTNAQPGFLRKQLLEFPQAAAGSIYFGFDFTFLYNYMRKIQGIADYLPNLLKILRSVFAEGTYKIGGKLLPFIDIAADLAPPALLRRVGVILRLGFYIGMVVGVGHRCVIR